MTVEQPRPAAAIMSEHLTTDRPFPGLALVSVAPRRWLPRIGPFVSIARFSLTDRVFPPHPHAGFTAMTYVLPGSPGAMLNRDSLGSVDVIRPGGAHWTVANAGMMHEETPEADRVAVEGFQIFIKHPASFDDAAPEHHHAAPEEIEGWSETSAARVRLILGSIGRHRAATRLPVDATMIEVRLERGATFAWTMEPGHRGGVFVESGRVSMDGGSLIAPAVATPMQGQHALTMTASADALVYLFAGPALDEETVARGPFMLASQTALDEANARYRRGGMGSLPPRPLGGTGS